jgi:hypothetical protein
MEPCSVWNKLDVMQKMWEWAKKRLTTEEKSNKFLKSTDHKESAVWHVAANCNRLFFYRIYVSRL